MLQKFILILVPLICFLPREDNYIEWNPARKLTWNDFKGAPDASSTNAALTQ